MIERSTVAGLHAKVGPGGALTEERIRAGSGIHEECRAQHPEMLVRCGRKRGHDQAHAGWAGEGTDRTLVKWGFPR